MAMNVAFNLHAKPLRFVQIDGGKIACPTAEPSEDCSNIECPQRRECFGDFLDSLAESTSLNLDCSSDGPW